MMPSINDKTFYYSRSLKSSVAHPSSTTREDQTPILRNNEEFTQIVKLNDLTEAS